MRLTVICGEEVACLEVSPDLEFENFIALCNIEIPQLASVPLTELRFIFNGTSLPATSSNLKKDMQLLGLKDGDAVNIERNALPPASQSSFVRSGPAASASSGAPAVDISSILSSLVKGIKVPTAGTSKKEDKWRAMSKNIFDTLAHPGRLDQLRSASAAMADTYEKNPTDYEAFHVAFLENKALEERRIRLMNDETSEEGQRYIAELIDKQNIDFTHQFAMEHMPEAFIPVHMLYIRMKINGQPVIAFVDSGAQVSILSESCARRCNVSRLVDDRFRATAMGVGGSQKFLGRIHSCQVQVEGHIFSCPFDVMADRNIDILFGLNTLRRHHCSIDLQRNVLRFGDGTETPFLNEEEYRRETESKEQADIEMTIERSAKHDDA